MTLPSSVISADNRYDTVMFPLAIVPIQGLHTHDGWDGGALHGDWMNRRLTQPVQGSMHQTARSSNLT